MFQTEDCPAKVASNLSGGFEGSEYASRRNIQWKRPPKFVLNDDLLVGSGGESTEARCENLRIAKVLEAFYPHRSVIPSRPSVSPLVEDESYDDTKTPHIRLIPIEDELEAESSHNPIAPPAVSGIGPDLSLAASAALSALMKTKEQGTLVDADLLVKFLTDPEIVKSLMMGTLNTRTTEPPQPGNAVQSRVSCAPPMNLHLQKAPLPLSSGLKPLPSPADDAQIRNGAYPMNVKRDEQVPVRNVDYFKNLIREHGGVTNNNYKASAENDNMKLVKAKVQKPCMYFGRARGCKLGESCLYLHDRSNRFWTDVATDFPRDKRLKFRT